MDGSSSELYGTDSGRLIVGEAENVLGELAADSVDLVVTSPPFALLRQKSYGNLEQSEYVDWLVSFGVLVRRVLKETGSFVLDLGGAYQRGKPVRSLYNFRVLLRMCDECGFHLAEEFFWHNPAKLPSPIEWVNKRKIRAKDSVNTVWWLSKTENPKADVSKVLGAVQPADEKVARSRRRSFTRPRTVHRGTTSARHLGRTTAGRFRRTCCSIPTRRATQSTSASAKSSDSARILRGFPKRCQPSSSVFSQTRAIWCWIFSVARTPRAKQPKNSGGAGLALNTAGNMPSPRRFASCRNGRRTRLRSL